MWVGAIKDKVTNKKVYLKIGSFFLACLHQALWLEVTLCISKKPSDSIIDST
jgi:hypothetical protein